MAADFGPVGKASVDIGASLAPLRKGLEQARTMLKGAMAPLRISFQVSQASLRAAQAAVRGLVGALQRTMATLTSPLALLGIGGGAFGLGALFSNAVQSASDLQEATSKATAVYGKSVKGILDESEKLSKRFGINRKEFIDAAVNLGRFGLTSNMTAKESADLGVKLGKLGADLASFDNIGIEDAFQKLQSALSGEAEPLRKHGVLMTEARVEQEAYAAGIAKRGAKLTEANKVMARAALIQKDLKAASGDLERTAGGFANQYRMMTGRFQNLIMSLGEALLPAATLVIRTISRLVEQLAVTLESHKPKIQAWADTFAKAFSSVVVAIGDAPTYLNYFWQEAKHVADMVRQVFTNLAVLILDAFEWMGRSISTVFDNMLAGVKNVAMVMLTVFGGIAKTIPEMLMKTLMGDEKGLESIFSSWTDMMEAALAPDVLKAMMGDITNGVQPFNPSTGLFGNLPQVNKELKDARDNVESIRKVMLPTDAAVANKETPERTPLTEKTARFAGQLNKNAQRFLDRRFASFGSVDERRQQAREQAEQRRGEKESHHVGTKFMRLQINQLTQRIKAAQGDLRRGSANGDILAPTDPRLAALDDMARQRDEIRQALGKAKNTQAGQALMPVGTAANFENGRPVTMGLEEFAKKSIAAGFLTKPTDPAEKTANNTEKLVERMDKLINLAGRPNPAVVW